MSLNASNNNPLYLEIKPSRMLARLLLFFYSGGLLLLWLLPITPWVKLPLSLWLLYDWHRQWSRRVTLTDPQAYIAIAWQGSGEWRLQQRNGQSHCWLTLQQSVNHPWLTTLNFSEGHRLALMMDSSDANSLRRLRVRLTLGDGSSAESE